MLETLDYTIRIGSIPTFLYFDLFILEAGRDVCRDGTWVVPFRLYGKNFAGTFFVPSRQSGIPVRSIGIPAKSGTIFII